MLSLRSLSLCLILTSCVNLAGTDARMTTLIGVQDGSHGDVAGIARPVFGMTFEGDLDVGADFLGGESNDESGEGEDSSASLRGTLGVHLSSFDFGGLNEGDVQTDTLGLGLTTGLRWAPDLGSSGVKPYVGLGLALQYLDIEFRQGEDGQTDLGMGPYVDLGLEYEAWTFVWRRITGMDMEFSREGHKDVQLDQFMLGWSTGF